jgi:acetyl esterase/lipase
MSFRLQVVLILTVVAFSPTIVTAQDSAVSEPEDANVAYTRIRDVIYGRKFGTALTMDVFMPNTGANSAGIIVVCSGGWVSSHDKIDRFQDLLCKPHLNNGYTVFMVVHSSSPRYSIPDILQDLHRSVRFIRSRADDFSIDPDRLGIQGFSSGGHLSLMQALAGDLGNPDSKDPIERFSSRVQAAVVGAPPSDFLNYGGPGKIAVGNGHLAGFHQAFAFTRFDPKSFVITPVADENERLIIGKKISPVTHVTADDPPILIIHGELDRVVPIQQSELLVRKMKEVGVPVSLVVKKGAGHFWNDHHNDRPHQHAWFKRWLLSRDGVAK